MKKCLYVFWPICDYYNTFDKLQNDNNIFGTPPARLAILIYFQWKNISVNWNNKMRQKWEKKCWPPMTKRGPIHVRDYVSVSYLNSYYYDEWGLPSITKSSHFNKLKYQTKIQNGPPNYHFWLWTTTVRGF